MGQQVAWHKKEYLKNQEHKENPCRGKMHFVEKTEKKRNNGKKDADCLHACGNFSAPSPESSSACWVDVTSLHGRQVESEYSCEKNIRDTPE